MPSITSHPFTSAKLSKAAREALKAALAAHTGWGDYRTGRYSAKGSPLHTGNATRDDLLLAAYLLEIDAESVIAAANNAEAEQAQATIETIGEILDEGFEGRDPSELVAEALAPIASISAILAPGLYQEVQTGITALARAAAQGPRIVDRVESVTVFADGPAPEPVEMFPAPRQRGKPIQARAYFGLQSEAGGETWRRILNDVHLPVYDYKNAPAVDKLFIWLPELAGAFAACAANGSHLWLVGPAGTGKSEAARQFAALGGRHFVRIAIHRTTEPADLLGQYLPQAGGGFVWRDGPLTRAIRIPGTVILIDEPTFLRPGSLALFQSVLDFGQIYLATGETVTRAPGVLIVAADNTNGAGDGTGRYADTAAMNLMLIDRFSLMVNVDYLPEAREASLLSKRTGVPLGVAKHMVQYATMTRINFAGGKLTAGLTFRRLYAWASGAKLGIPSKIAFTMAVITPADPTDREFLRQLEATQGGHGRIDATLAGVSWESTAAGIGS